MKKSKLQQAKEKNEIARLSLDTVIRENKLKIFAEYDATKSSVKRRQPVIEHKNEDGIFPMLERQKGANIGRDLERNYSPARGIIHQFKVNVVGSLGKIQVNIENNQGKEATDWFNGEWAKDCDYRDEIHFSTVLQNVVSSVMREGDLLSLVDDGLVDNSGKLLHWESDQIAPVSDDILKKSQYKYCTQENGILRGEWGKIIAYACSGKRGMTIIDKAEDVTFLPREQAWLVKNPWRLNQGRGIPCVLASATNFVDLYEILSKELQTAKVAAGQYASVKRKNAVTDWDNPAAHPEYLPENTGATSATVAAETANSATATEPNYNRLESFTGGYTDYLDDGDEVSFADITRPNVHLMEFCEAVLGHAGASVGLARAYTILRADSSYTAFRGDMILSWVTFYAMQKWLERAYADRVARRVLTWAQRKKKIKPLVAGWEKTISWTWPTMPHVDEAREEAAIQNALKNATIDYAGLLGPDWQNKLTAFSKQLDIARKLKIPLSIFETVSGGALNQPDGEQTTPQKKGK